MWRVGSWHCDRCGYDNYRENVECRKCVVGEGRVCKETTSRMLSDGANKFQNSSKNVAPRLPVGKVKNAPVQHSPTFLNPAEDPLAAFEAAMQKLDSKKASRGRPDEITPPRRKDIFLNNPKRGRDKIQREMQGQRKGRGMRMVAAKLARLSNKEVERAKLSKCEMGELVQLRQRVKILEAENAKCVREHGTQEVKELRLMVKKCQEEHLHKKEELYIDQHSTSNCRVKQEREEFSGDCMKREGLETVNIWDDIKSENKGTEYFEKAFLKDLN